MSFSSNQPLLSNQLPLSIEWPTDPDRFLELIDLTYKRTADAVNTKTGGYYLLQEVAAFNRFYSLTKPFSFRAVYRSTYDIIDLNGGNIGASATVSFATGITGLVSLTNIYGTGKTTSNKYFGLNYPYVYVQGTTLFVINPEPTPLSQCMVVLEYVKES